jgi:hypothetical protein
VAPREVPCSIGSTGGKVEPPPPCESRGGQNRRNILRVSCRHALVELNRMWLVMGRESRGGDGDLATGVELLVVLAGVHLSRVPGPDNGA